MIGLIENELSMGRETMANFDFDIGVIGGGAAGLTVASGSSQLGAKTLLVASDRGRP